METNRNRPTEPEREERGDASSALVRRSPKVGKRKLPSRTISDEEFVRVLSRRTGRSHERWLSLLAAARAARAPASRPPRDSSPRRLSEPVPRPRTAGDLDDLLAALRDGPVALAFWSRQRGLAMADAYKLVRALRRLGHPVKGEGRPAASTYRLMQ